MIIRADELVVGVAIAFFISYIIFVRSVRWKSWYELELSTKDPANLLEAHRIYSNFAFKDFQFLGVKGLEFGFFRTYAIPTISKLLVHTKQLAGPNVLRRYDDTDLIVREMTENAPNSVRANLAVQRLNFMHGQYAISNIDYIYVLCIFVVEPIRWVNRYGFRRVHRKEVIASFVLWKDIGVKMGIKSIPDSYEAMEAFVDTYEEQKMEFVSSNRIIADATVGLLLSDVPAVLHPLGRRVIHALCDNRLRKAMGFPSPFYLIPLRFMVDGVLFIGGLVTRFLLLPRQDFAHRTPGPRGGENKRGVDQAFGVKHCPLFHHYGSTIYSEGYVTEHLGPEYMPKGGYCPFGAVKTPGLGPLFK